MRTCTWMMAALLLLALAACGGGSGDGSGAAPDILAPEPDDEGSPPTLGIDRGGRFGVLTAFSSIIVGGVAYDTSDAEILISGMPGSENDLRVGNVIEVLGSVNEDGVTGTAEVVRSEPLLVGPISTLDVQNNSLVVLGQPVTVLSTTSFAGDFSPRDVNGLPLDAVVRIHGTLGGNGRIIASRIEPATDNESYRLTGKLDELDTAARRLRINALSVDYASATLADFPGDAPEVDQLVRLEGSRLEGDLLFADVLAFEGNRLRRLCFEDDDDDNCEVEIEGYVSRFVSVEDFDVNGVRVFVDEETEFDEGAAADLALDVRIEIEGIVDENGLLLAEEIEFLDDLDPVKIEATASAVDQDTGVITLLGIGVEVTPRTRLEDFSSSVSFPFVPGDIRVGDRLEVVGREIEEVDVDIRAARLERKDDDDSGEVFLRGFVEAVAPPQLTILGVTIQTDAGTDFDADGGELPAEEFFARVQPGDLVEVEGTQIGDTVIQAELVERDD